MSKVRIIADCHGKAERYFNIAKVADYSIQIGDFGFDYEILNNLDENRHKIFAGNHENHDEIHKWPHWLGKYGYRELGPLKFFFVGGAFSIDWQQRLAYEQWPNCGEKCWWPNEELTQNELEAAITEYSYRKPKIVLTHDAPRTIGNKVGSPTILRNFGYNPNAFTTRTSEALECMFKAWQPDLWIHGHFHKSHRTKIGCTAFIGLAELEYIDIDEDGKIDAN